MQIDRRALYNSLRQNWVMDPSLAVKAWQVEDYRALHLDILFERLAEENIHLEKESFLAFAEHVDSPEDLTDDLIADLNLDRETQDKIYLLIFELWRRLLPEKPCLSVFCDELDHQIHLYDLGSTENAEAIQDAIANLQVILDENTDSGADAVEVFECVKAACANDIESFLYDFIALQIDNQNTPYASELLDGFSNYVSDVKWFDFLRARVVSSSDPELSQQLISKLVHAASKNPDLEFNLEMLTFMIQGGDKATFNKLVKLTTDLLEIEDDFKDLLTISADFYRCLDNDHVEHFIQNIISKRSNLGAQQPFNPKDPHLSEFFKLLV